MDFQQSTNLIYLVVAFLACGFTLVGLAGLFAAFYYRRKFKQVSIMPAVMAATAVPIVENAPYRETANVPGARWLVIARGVGRPVMLKLDPRGNTLGRSGQNQMVITDTQVSRFHARIVKNGDNWMIADLHSSNGTFVNDQPITIHPLSLGDRIRLGENIELVFQA